LKKSMKRPIAPSVTNASESRLKRYPHEWNKSGAMSLLPASYAAGALAAGI
jgi:hypothetical protein